MANHSASFQADQTLGKHAARLELLSDIARNIGRSHDVDDVLQRAAQLTQKLFNYQHVGIFLFDRERQVLLMRAIAGEYARYYSARHVLEIDQGMVGWVCKNGRSLLANDVRIEPSYINLYPNEVHTLSELTVPIRLDAEIMGVLDIQSSSIDAFDEDDLIVKETLAEQIAIALKNACLYQSLEQELVEKMHVEQSLRESERKLTTLISNLPGITYRCQNDQLWTMEFVSQGALGLTGYPSSALLLNNQINFVDLIYPEDRQMVWDTVQAALLQQKPFDLVYRINTASGQTKFVMDRGQGVFSDQNELQAIEGFITDITDRMLMDAQLKASLAEKEVLLKEVHHRVKNNLEVILSLTDMQSRRVQDEQARESFRVLQERIRTIALVHESLYRSHSLAFIPIQNYLQNLTDNLTRAFSSPGMRLIVDAEDVIIGVDQAIPCGLIVTELVTNSLKYAFPHQDKHSDFNPDLNHPEIRIQLRKAGNDICLDISDNGVGLPPGFDPQQAKSLGLRLVRSLVGQVHGTLEIRDHAGTHFRIRFKDRNKGDVDG